MAQGDQPIDGELRVLRQEASAQVPRGAQEILLWARRRANGETGYAGEEAERCKREGHEDTED